MDGIGCGRDNDWYGGFYDLGEKLQKEDDEQQTSLLVRGRISGVKESHTIAAGNLLSRISHKYQVLLHDLRGSVQSPK